MVCADVVPSTAMWAGQPACPGLGKHSAGAGETTDSSLEDCAARLRSVVSAMTEMRRQHDETARVVELVTAALEKQDRVSFRLGHTALPGRDRLAAADAEAPAGPGPKTLAEDGRHGSPSPPAPSPPEGPPADDRPGEPLGWHSPTVREEARRVSEASSHGCPAPQRSIRTLRRKPRSQRAAPAAVRENGGRPEATEHGAFHESSAGGTNHQLRMLMQPTRDLRDSQGGSYRLAVKTKRLIRSQKFERCMGFIILANALCIGMETQQDVQGGSDPIFHALEHMFLTVYLLEIGARLFAWGTACFWDYWFIFDLILVVGGCIGSWVVGLLPDNIGSGLPNEIMSKLMVFRICRLLRMLRALRMVKQFRPIWRLVYGLITSFNTMVSTLSLVTLVLYTFACLGVELITKDPSLAESANPEVQAIVGTNFEDLFVTMLFLFQFVTLDSVASVYMPLVKEKPLLALYFLALLLLVSISLMNLVMAKIVEGALDAARNDRETELLQRKEMVKKMVPELEKLFACVDQDGSGHVDLEEVLALEGKELGEELAPLVALGSLTELFDMLDMDKSGEITQEEFIEGILSMHVSDLRPEQVHMFQMVRAVRDKVYSIEKSLKRADSQAVAAQREAPCSVDGSGQGQGSRSPPGDCNSQMVFCF